MLVMSANFDQEILEKIASFGCSVVHIPAEDDLPPFSFSVGITKTVAAPELIVIGLRQELAHVLINDYYEHLRGGETFRAGERYAGFLEGFDVVMARVAESFYEEYLGYNLGFYEGANFEVLQLIYPNTQGFWPWEAEADAWFRARQPLLQEEGR
ncbi:hypothetical protein HNQ39_000573 [Armatimonas rosea]|uniref:DUF4262 domain-containing protein n=2 Tax=Armatimonas rosea TaxID=685828 RepID=A0A7W9W592_ARMRO|nr:hypothetical protein [Armatimonas rosea]